MSKIKKVQIEDRDGNKYYPVTHSSLIKGLNESNDFEKTEIIDNPDITNMGDLKIINKEDIHDNNIHYYVQFKGSEIFRIENTSTKFMYLVEMENDGISHFSIDYYYDNEYEYREPNIPPFYMIKNDVKGIMKNSMFIVPPKTKASIGIDICAYKYFAERYENEKFYKLRFKRVVKVDINNKRDVDSLINNSYKFNSYFTKNNNYYELDTKNKIINFSLIPLRNDDYSSSYYDRRGGLKLTNNIEVIDSTKLREVNFNKNSKNEVDGYSSKELSIEWLNQNIPLNETSAYKGTALVKLKGGIHNKLSHTYLNGDLTTNDNLIFFDQTEGEKTISLFVIKDRMGYLYIKSNNDIEITVDNFPGSKIIKKDEKQRVYSITELLPSGFSNFNISNIKIRFKGSIILHASNRFNFKSNFFLNNEMNFWDNYSVYIMNDFKDKINKINKDFDSLKQSGTRINQKLVDNLATHNIEASTSNSIEENIDKILDIKAGSEKPQLKYPLNLLIINERSMGLLGYDAVELVFSNSKTKELGVVDIDSVSAANAESLLLGLEEMLKEELEYYDNKENILIILNIEQYSKEIASFISSSKLTRNMLVTHPFTKLTKAISNPLPYEEYIGILELIVDDEVLENIENYSINFVDTY